jgi:exopolyphosphatase / guanosine-5'-triphosphate,3'-diphosphate pyrophosphatase
MRVSNGARVAVVDLGSNSVRLVVFEGRGRNPVAIFNEKAVLRLGRGLQSTGRLNQEGMAQAFPVLARYHTLARAMGVEWLEVLGTAAVRDASNGEYFVRALQEHLPGLTVRVLSGPEEAELSALGVLCGIPGADGILADIGGGSLELVRLTPTGPRASETTSLGVIRLADRAGGDPERAREIADADLAQVPWLAEGEGRDLYLVGGAFRALARVHIGQVGYPLHMVHQYTIGREEARQLAGMVAGAGKRALERIPGLSRKRVEDLPFAAVVLRRVLRVANARRVVFSASGLREGWYMRLLPEEIRLEDPLLAAGRHYAGWLGRNPDLPGPLFAWTSVLFPDEGRETARLREAACLMSDIGSRDHPEFRSEQAFFRVLRQPGLGFDHHARAFLALAVAIRYEAEADAEFLRPARLLLDVASTHRAEVLGLGLRLAYTLCGGTPEVLAATSLSVEGSRLVLSLEPSHGVFAGESLLRRLDRLAEAMGLDPVVR